MKPKNPTKSFLFLLSRLCLVVLVLGSGPIMAVQAGAEFDLEVELKAPQHVAPGSELVINLSYSNIGTDASPADTKIQVTLPEGLSYASAVDQDENPKEPTSIDGDLLTWEVGALPAGSCCAHIWITTSVAGDLTEETSLTITAEISSATAESNMNNNQASVTSQVCDMAGSKKEADIGQAKPGDVVIYTITLRMAQRRTQNEHRERYVTLTDLLPPTNQARFLGWIEQPPGASFDSNQLRWQGRVGENEQVRLRYRLGIEGDVPPGEPITNRARLQWQGGEMELDPVKVSTFITKDDHMFGPGGGQWQHAWGLTLTVPPNGVTEMTRFQFRQISETPQDAPPGWGFAHRYFELRAFQFGEIHRFNQPINITVKYNQADLNGINQNTLRLWYREGPGEPWAMLGEPLQNHNGEISFSTDHFAEFALFGRSGYELMIPMVVR